ncbi:MAG TPA: hypothetical protein VEQ35_07590 [Beijerinckia sp.]|jgi:hypothetical protein|nr:hypothetical protein [Beijerinckia sp.]
MIKINLLHSFFSNHFHPWSRAFIATSFGALLSLVFPYCASAAAEMSFQLVQIGHSTNCGSACPQVISAEGEISNETPDAFLNFMRGNLHSQTRAIVFIHSPGGKVVASMELGKIFRKLGIAVVVARAQPAAGHNAAHFVGARCFSACVYALMGARKRVIPPESEVGLHRMFLFAHDGPAGAQQRHQDDGEMAAMLQRYSRSMGISPSLVATAEHMDPDMVHILSRAEIAKWNLGTPKL